LIFNVLQKLYHSFIWVLTVAQLIGLPNSKLREIKRLAWRENE